MGSWLGLPLCGKQGTGEKNPMFFAHQANFEFYIEAGIERQSLQAEQYPWRMCRAATQPERGHCKHHVPAAHCQAQLRMGWLHAGR